MRVLLVDPSLFTAPYDAALTAGLAAVDVEPIWAVRPLRPGERRELPSQCALEIFYRRVDAWHVPWARALRPLAKGCAHLAGLLQLLRRVRALSPAVVHFQWLPLPLLDAVAILLIRPRCAVVLTVHDTVPFNGERRWLQRLGLRWAMSLVDRMIVHTASGRDRLVTRGAAPGRVAIVPHGPLALAAAPAPRACSAPPDGRWTFVLFGQLKPYKGIDVLIEALDLLPQPLRERSRTIVAGQPHMDLEPARRRIAELALDPYIELRAWRHSEQEMAELFAMTNCFVFPYRQVDASGVYFLVKPLGKLLIASALGVFAEDLRKTSGRLLAIGDRASLSDALAHAIIHRPRAAAAAPDTAWETIGGLTRTLYLEAARARGSTPSLVVPRAPQRRHGV